MLEMDFALMGVFSFKAEVCHETQKAALQSDLFLGVLKRRGSLIGREQMTAGDKCVGSF